MSEARSAIERDIIAKSWQVDTSEIDGTWLDTLEFAAFQQAWDDLADYYRESSGDTQISLAVLREYVTFTRLLRTVMLHDEYDVDRQQQAEAALKVLEQTVEEMIRSTERRSAGKQG